jgi:hypothetical protein
MLARTAHVRATLLSVRNTPIRAVHYSAFHPLVGHDTAS